MVEEYQWRFRKTLAGKEEEEAGAEIIRNHTDPDQIENLEGIDQNSKERAEEKITDLIKRGRVVDAEEETSFKITF